MKSKRKSLLTRRYQQLRRPALTEEGRTLDQGVYPCVRGIRTVGRIRNAPGPLTVQRPR
jgi:hypothetical protein